MNGIAIDEKSIGERISLEEIVIGMSSRARNAGTSDCCYFATSYCCCNLCTTMTSIWIVASRWQQVLLGH